MGSVSTLVRYVNSRHLELANQCRRAFDLVAGDWPGMIQKWPIANGGQRRMRYFANPASPAPAGSIFNDFTSAMKSFALGPVSNTTLVPGSGANDQLPSADGLIVPCLTM